MAVFRTELEVWELRTALVCCVGLFMANANVWRMKWSADLASTLITFSTVMLLHLFRMKKTPPVTKTWHLCLDVLLYYLGNQVTMALIWQQFCIALEHFKDLSTESQGFMDIFMERLSWFAIVKTDFVFIVKTGLALLITYKAMTWASFLDYILPVRRPDPEVMKPIVKQIVKKKPRARKASKNRSRSRKRRAR
ncbi:uncharacterized protein Dwil_GK18206 [Drosophila willistoni]|uniref:Uncharacterized protein n=1 Tax=Drosophila willistoni TaxID=7260 RepID=B4NPK8_DROWI|nr:uncharacterized protein LOC6652849 [Drosophila willistoni]EDW86448.1 uncharacterized protein Dwil_GK18206 [Drosophila willistoni]